VEEGPRPAIVRLATEGTGGGTAGPGPTPAVGRFIGSAFGGSAFGGSAFGGSAFGGSTFHGSALGGPALDGSAFGGSAFGGSALGAACTPAAVTRNECPHLGHRIFRPAGGTRRSSIWYGALHDSHSTFSIDPSRA
jgi:hypothetical protein